MELYLRWLDRYERGPGENAPLGLILCADKNEEQIELLELAEGSIRVASYLTELPPRELLERKLTEAIGRARERVVSRVHGDGKVSEALPPLYAAGQRQASPRILTRRLFAREEGRRNVDPLPAREPRATIGSRSCLGHTR